MTVHTSNDVEGRHHKLNHRAKENLSLYILLLLLFSEAKLLPTQIKMGSDG